MDSSASLENQILFLRVCHHVPFSFYNVNTVQRESTARQGIFDKYLREKLAHLKGEDRSLLETTLRRYEHLFYGLKCEELGCTS